MLQTQIISAIVFLCSCVAARNARPLTPPMGWNSYNYYNCRINETVIQDNAKGLVESGFAKLGYTIVTPDCGWPASKRNTNGQLTWDAQRFPSGFPALGEYLHSRGLRFGLYSGAGVYQCGSNADGVQALPASLGYELKDAQTFESWGADALKYDNCWTNSTNYVDYSPTLEADPSVRFRVMADALDNVNRSIEYVVCQWGVGYSLGEWAPKIAGSWRISNDIQNNWKSIWRIVNQAVPFAKHTGVGKYADLDMLIVGLKAINFEEERLHFSMWAINKSPLTIGASMVPSLAPKESLQIMSNKEIIAINQDPLGEQARLVRRYTEAGYDIWAGNLSASKMVVAVVNWANSTTRVTLNPLNEIGILAASNMRDVWAATDLGTLDGSHSVTLNLKAHEAKILVLADVKLTSPPPKSAGSTYYAAMNASIAGGARIQDCSGQTHSCLPTKSKVGNVGNKATIKFSNVSSSKNGTKLIGVDYINYDVALSSAWNNGSNTRNLTLSVNGGRARLWAFPISGGDWFETGRLDVELDGFRAGGGNEILLASDGRNWAPDVVGLEVYH